jgi:hypothetical protein
MAIRDASDREIVAYFQFLVDHESQCAEFACPLCATLSNFCELAASLLFSIDLYPVKLSDDCGRPNTAAQ